MGVRALRLSGIAFLAALATAGSAGAAVRVNLFTDPRFDTGPYLTATHAPHEDDADRVVITFDRAAETYSVSNHAGAAPEDDSYYCEARDQTTVECRHPAPSTGRLVIESTLNENDRVRIERSVPYTRSLLIAGKVTGADGRDRILGTRAGDDLRGRKGSDRLDGGGDGDLLSGGPDEDVVVGGRGGDAIEGNSGDDTINARDHFADRVRCGPGDDVAKVDPRDTVEGCESVRRGKPAGSGKKVERGAGRRAVAVEPDFHGVVAQLPMTAADVNRMSAAGVGAVRFPISWQATERRPGLFNWSGIDEYMRAIAAVGAEPLPFVSVKPDWLQTDSSGQPMSTPESRAAWEDFAAAVVERYGPGGTFIAENPDIPPVETWQLWNEPNLRGFWGADPDPDGYATLAELGSAAMHAVDPGARIMLAGLAPAKRGYKPWRFLELALPEIDPGTFEVVAIHPYGEKLKDVRAQIADARREMAQAGFGDLPLAVTEIGWGSQQRGVKTLQGTLREQAQKLRDVYADLAVRRAYDISQVFWFSWRDSSSEVDQCGFCATTGLLRSGGQPKPALEAFAASARRLRR